MKLLKTLRVKVPPEDITDPDLEWGEQEVKLDINSVTHGVLSGDRVDMRIGGRNLFTSGGWEFYSSYATLVSYDGTKSLIFEETLGTTSTTVAIKNVGYVTKPGQYIMSGFLKINGEIPEEDYFLNITTASPQDTVERTYDPATGYFTVSQVVGDNSWTIHATARGKTSESNRTVEISDFKYEKGNVATDWTPAPEDSLKLSEVVNAIYPVGSIYTSVVDINPGSMFGGTWVPFAAGRTIVGVDTSQTEFNTVLKTGGHKSLQSHTHTITIASGGAHTHTVSGTAESAGAHSHTITVNSGGAHTHTVSGTAASAGSHTHSTQGWLSNQSGSNDRAVITRNRISADPVDSTGVIRPAGAHTHTVSGTAASAGAHSHTASSNSTGAHTHTVSGTAASAGSHTHGATAASEGAGDSQNLQPYITVYMWRRTA